MTSIWLLLFLIPAVTPQLDDVPRLLLSPQVNPLQKPAGQQINLLCQVDKLFAESKPGLLWKKNGGLISSITASVAKLDDFTISLTIRNAKAEDSGVYLCQAQLQNGTLLQKTVDVVIFEDYHFLEKATSTGPVMATAAVNISCEVFPKRDTFTTIWTRPSHPMWTPGKKHRLYHAGAILEIINYDPQQDAGDYTCKVSDTTRGVSLSRKIIVGSDKDEFVSLQIGCIQGRIAVLMSSTREAIKCSLLQQKTTRRTGTLRKKTKLFYGDPSWVVLCVHDNKIPCLEWYHTEESIRDHQPFKVIDLLYVLYVNHVLSDPRTFVIGLSEVEPIELVALQPVTTTEWIEVTTETLKRLSILTGSTNIYEPGTLKTEFKEQTNKQAVQNSLMDMPPTPIIHHRLERPESLKSSCSHVSFQGGGREQRPCSLRPPLPPRRPQEPLRPRRSGSFSDLPTNGCLSPSDEHSVTPHILTPLYDTPRSEFVTGVATPPRSPMQRMNGDSRDLQLSQSIYDTLSPSHHGSSPLQSTISTNSLCSSLSSELRLSTVLPTSENSEYDYIREGFHTKVKYVSLNLSIIVEHILFVEIRGRIWVAGWSDMQDKQLSAILNFGDELVEVEGHIVRGMTDIPQLFYNVSTPGTPISLVLRPTPFGINVTLMKPIKKDKDIGIRLHKHKNRIAEIIPDSSAARRGLTAVLPSSFHGDHQSSTVITEVAGRRLNPFSRNDQFFQRYEEIREGAEFVVTVHPHDFMKEMKHQLSSTKNYKAYLPSL